MTDGTRRGFLAQAAGAGLLLAACAKAPELHAEGPEGKKGAAGEDDVSPPEDLMREHGALNRILLIYEEGIRRLSRPEPFPVEAIGASAEIIKRFIEAYHEKLEEDFIFPRFEKAGKFVELVATLRRQHQAGRALTDTILRLATPASIEKADSRKQLAETFRLFVRMYRPHEAREDTVLFPAFRSLVTPKEFDALGEQFEDKEHQLFGKEGFEGVVAQTAKLEQALGIYELDQFTPPP